MSTNRIFFKGNGWLTVKRSFVTCTIPYLTQRIFYYHTSCGRTKRQNFKTSKECRSIVRDESSVYFNVTAKHVGHLVATVYKPTVPCMITIELSDI